MIIAESKKENTKSTRKIFCLFSSDDFKPFYVGSTDKEADEYLRILFEKVFLGNGSELCKTILEKWKSNSEVYIHVLQEVNNKKEEEGFLTYWQEQLDKPADDSMLGDKFSEGIRKEF